MTKTPAPWQGPTCVAMGGLWALGFDAVQRLYCITPNGLGVLDPLSGEKLERDEDDDHYDAATETVAGIGVANGQRAKVAGAGGGIQTRHRLAVKTTDGWRVELKAIGTNADVLLVGPDGGATRVARVEPVRACGFSPRGDILVIGESHTITIFHRRAPTAG